MGHDAKLMPAAYVKPYVKRQRNDAADAEPICEAVQRPTMRFVPVKSEEQQGVLMLHRARELLVRQKTMLINALPAHLEELAIIARLVAMGIRDLVVLIDDTDQGLVPDIVRSALLPLCDQLRHVQGKVGEMDRQILEWHRSNALSQRLETIPGIGPVTASAIAATITDVSSFRSGRQLAAWIGLVPRQSSSGGKERLGRITRQDGSLHPPLAGDRGNGCLALWPQVKSFDAMGDGPAVAKAGKGGGCRPGLANKMARIVWALMTQETSFRTATG